MKPRLLTLLLVLLPVLLSPVRANLILNGGFETGTSDSWIFAPAAAGSYFVVTPTLTSFGYAAQQGIYAAGFGAIEDSMDTISQNFGTIAGRTYDFGFWLHNSAGWSGSTLTARWDSLLLTGGGMPPMPVTSDVGSFGWTEYSYSLLATSAETTIQFSGLSNAEWIMLDNVNVTEKAAPAFKQDTSPGVASVPDTGGTGLLLAAALGVMTMARSRKWQTELGGVNR